MRGTARVSRGGEDNKEPRRCRRARAGTDDGVVRGCIAEDAAGRKHSSILAEERKSTGRNYHLSFPCFFSFWFRDDCGAAGSWCSYGATVRMHPSFSRHIPYTPLVFSLSTSTANLKESLSSTFPFRQSTLLPFLGHAALFCLEFDAVCLHSKGCSWRRFLDIGRDKLHSEAARTSTDAATRMNAGAAKRHGS